MKYAEKLKDPRWQKKRLEIFNRDGFACRFCSDTKEMLTVHHLYYLSGYDPWDYENSALITLCETCHKREYEERKLCENELLHTLSTKPYSLDDVLIITDFVGRLRVHEPLELFLDAILDLYNDKKYEQGKIIDELMEKIMPKAKEVDE